MVSKRKYTSISVPRPLHERIRILAQKRKQAMYQVVEDAVLILDLLTRRPYAKSDLPNIEKAAWYAFKLANSVGAFKENPTRENYQRLLNTINQIAERTLVDTSLLETVVAKLDPSRKKTLKARDKIELNDVTKHVIAQIILSYLTSDRESSIEVDTGVEND